MDYIKGSLPTIPLITSGASVKNAKQKKQKRQFNWPMQTAQTNTSSQDINTSSDKTNKLKEEIEDRRAGEERRLASIKRGRWLDSRDKKDRRNPDVIYMKI